MRESTIERNVVAHARKLNMVAHKMQGEMGMPDYVFFYEGQCFFIEFKAPGAKPRKIQLFKHRMLAAQSFAVYVVDSITQGRNIINSKIKCIIA